MPARSSGRLIARYWSASIALLLDRRQQAGGAQGVAVDFTTRFGLIGGACFGAGAGRSSLRGDHFADYHGGCRRRGGALRAVARLDLLQRSFY